LELVKGGIYFLETFSAPHQTFFLPPPPPSETVEGVLGIIEKMDLILFVSFRGIGPLRKGVMESTTLADLELRVGYPYLYTHQVHDGLSLFFIID